VNRVLSTDTCGRGNLTLDSQKITSGAAHDQLSKQASDWILEAQLFVDAGFLKRSFLWMVRTVPGRNVHALRPEPHRDLLLKARMNL
jgi:hypothetical protein